MKMPVLTNRHWSASAALMLLGVLPAIGGASRVIELYSSVEVTAHNARFFAAPTPVLLHIVSSVVFALLGAWQFSSQLRREHPTYHRWAGRVLVPSGLISALSGVWMALTYPPLLGDGTVLSIIRVLVGGAMAAFIVFAVAAILLKHIAAHRAWIIRAYALGIGAGTQPLTLAPILVVPSWYNEVGFTLGMAAGWLVNIAVAEWIIKRGGPTRAPNAKFSAA